MFELLTINEIQNTFSKRIKALRLAQNKTQEDFSRTIGVSKATYIRFENNASGSFGTFLSIIKGLRRINQCEDILKEESFSPVLALKENKNKRSRQRAVGQKDIPEIITNKSGMSILDKIKAKNAE